MVMYVLMADECDVRGVFDDLDKARNAGNKIEAEELEWCTVPSGKIWLATDSVFELRIVVTNLNEVDERRW